MTRMTGAIFFSASILMFACNAVLAQQTTRFECGASVEAEVWASWDANIHAFLSEQQLRHRLLKQGDVYALYDFQTYVHNLMSMARRCNRTSRLLEVARLIRAAYGALEPGTPSSPGRRWICRGGSICNDNNRLLNKEVALDSAQFLALASSVANALASSGAASADEEQMFISDTIQIVAEHLLRWGDDAAVSRIRKLTEATPDDVENNSSALFFTDHELWSIAIYAELSGILLSQERQSSGLVRLTDRSKARLRRHLGALLRFFAARVSFRRIPDGRFRNARLADLDRGYWRLLDTNRYAGYENEMKPVECVPSMHDNAAFKLEVRVPAESVRPSPNIGWDISHARRLVHALDALDRNRRAAKAIFSLKEAQLPPAGLSAAFAATLVDAIWNGDTARPLFSNYLSGANGWYRVAYDNGTGQCREGYPPYGLSESFATGGYITWARYMPVIGRLGETLYDLISRPDGESSQFIARYYPTLSKSESAQNKALATFMFFPSLVGVAGK